MTVAEVAALVGEADIVWTDATGLLNHVFCVNYDDRWTITFAHGKVVRALPIWTEPARQAPLTLKSLTPAGEALTVGGSLIGNASIPSARSFDCITMALLSQPENMRARRAHVTPEDSNRVMNDMDSTAHDILRRGVVIPACPLSLTESRRLDERRQRALCRYYIAAGAGGLAVGVHTTQFAIRNPAVGLFEPVLSLAAEELKKSPRPLVWIGGVCGNTRQAVAEAELIHRLGFHAGLVSLAALREASDDVLIAHCQELAAVIPLVGFYLQPAVGGRALSYRFWRRFLEIENMVAIKIAPFNRYQTLDVMRAVADARREDVALYTGNDDNIVTDLVTAYRFANASSDSSVKLRMVGGLLGHWAVCTSKAVGLLQACQAAAAEDSVPAELLQRGIEVTDCNAAVFDAANGFAGCIAGVHEVLRRQGLLAGIWCLDPNETLSPGQSEELDRVCRAYPHLMDDAFVAAHRDEWLRV